VLREGNHLTVGQTGVAPRPLKSRGGGAGVANSISVYIVIPPGKILDSAADLVQSS
jgi:hypothetical protein